MVVVVVVTMVVVVMEVDTIVVAVGMPVVVWHLGLGRRLVVVVRTCTCDEGGENLWLRW